MAIITCDIKEIKEDFLKSLYFNKDCMGGGEETSAFNSCLVEGNPLQYSCLENFHGQRSLACYSPRGHEESCRTETDRLSTHTPTMAIQPQGLPESQCLHQCLQIHTFACWWVSIVTRRKLLLAVNLSIWKASWWKWKRRVKKLA